MAGTRIGGLKASAPNKSKYGADFHKRIGKIGGQNGTTGGFYDRELARRAGKLGGKVSRRGPVVISAFVPDNTEFSEGFDQPSWRSRLLSKLGSK